MKANDLSELEIVDGDTRVMLKRGAPEQTAPHVVAAPMVMPAHGAPMAVAPNVPGTPAPDTPTTENDGLIEIVSPIVGTFYTAPSPSADAFVQVGSKVEPETVVCIVEAMKVMNEVKSEVKGTIRKMLIESGAAVEFGQPIFLVEPD